MRYVACLALLAACTSAPTDIRPAQSTAVVDGSILTLTLTASTQDLVAGQPDTLRATLSNAGPNEARLRFNTGCQILPYIRAANGTVVLPDYGAWGCHQALTTLVVPANQSVVREWIWTGSTAFQSEMPLRPLPPGTYHVTVVVEANNARLETAPLPIRLTN